jgi:uncharacterized protein
VRIFLFIAVFLTLIANAKSAVPQTAANNSLLWVVSRKDIPNPSYIFGTTHLICRDDYLWTDKMAASLEQSGKICFELDMDDPAVLTQVYTGMLNKNGIKLESYFTPDQYKLLRRYVKDSLGLSMGLLQDIKPLGVQCLLSKNGVSCPSPISYEDSIMKIAQKNKKEILGLELPLEVIALLENIPVSLVIEDIMLQVQNNKKNDSEYTKLIAAYRSQDIQALYTLVATSKDLGDMGAFLDERNRKWTPRIMDQMKNSSVFFAVGAGHLWGERGLISLLRKEGYTVEPLK